MRDSQIARRLREDIEIGKYLRRQLPKTHAEFLRQVKAEMRRKEMQEYIERERKNYEVQSKLVD